uniref:Uncharacterized protein n=1 Tax=Romanomermis culicivorax TaxID=13658 RepID=A0A915KU92_ROMCU
MFHMGSHDGFHVETDQSIAPEVWCGLGGDCHPQTTWWEEYWWWQHIGRPSIQRDKPAFEASSMDQMFNVAF